jgi:hypothetical protein
MESDWVPVASERSNRAAAGGSTEAFKKGANVAPVQ